MGRGEGDAWCWFRCVGREADIGLVLLVLRGGENGRRRIAEKVSMGIPPAGQASLCSKFFFQVMPGSVPPPSLRACFDKALEQSTEQGHPVRPPGFWVAMLWSNGAGIARDHIRTDEACQHIGRLNQVRLVQKSKDTRLRPLRVAIPKRSHDLTNK